MSTVTLSKWGNGQGILIPKRYREQLGLKAGDKVSITAEKERIIIERPEEKYTLEARKRNWDGKGKPLRDCDWGKPVGKEMW
jgi:antitoxin MazE